MRLLSPQLYVSHLYHPSSLNNKQNNHSFKKRSHKRKIMRNPNRPTAVATRQFFQWLEESFGGNLPMDGQRQSTSGSNTTVFSGSGGGSEILTSNETLQLDHLQRLFRHEALAIHVENFYPKSSAKMLANELAKEQEQFAQNWKISTSRGLESSDVLTLGTPYNMAVANGPDAIKKYYNQVPIDLQKRRRTINELQKGTSNNEVDDDSASHAKLIWPLDQLQLELDQLWPYGAGLARNPDNPTQCKSGGLTRITRGPTRWKKGFIHVDEMAPLSATSGYFSANIYLQLPPPPSNDGETNENNTTKNESTPYAFGTSNQHLPKQSPPPVLEIWPLGIRSKWEWYKNAHTLSALASQDAEGQMTLRKALGEPQRIYAKPGDLVLLCVQRPHAAVGFTTPNALRISLQSFIQYSGETERLLLEA